MFHIFKLLYFKVNTFLLIFHHKIVLGLIALKNGKGGKYYYRLFRISKTEACAFING